MKVFYLFVLTLLLLPVKGFTAPDRLEVIFLSQSKTTAVLQLLDKKSKGIYLSRLIAQEGDSVIDYSKRLAYEEEYVIDFNDPEGWEKGTPLNDKSCVPMGDGCFDPQRGYTDEVPNSVKINESVKKEKRKEPSPFELKTFSNEDIALVECQEGRYFDIFCGKESKRKKVAANLEVWIDTSSSLRNIDYSKEDSYCERRFFASKLKKDCRDAVDFSIFDTARRSLGSYDTLCDYMGSNDGRRTVSWIEANSAEHLVIITDVDEYHGIFREYLERTNAIIHGVGTKQITANDLISFVPSFVKSCK